jgi:hypothetical protein
MVTLDDEQYNILQSIKGLGSKDAEKIRNVLLAYLSEKSYIKHASQDPRLENIEKYNYVRYTWWKDVDVEKVSKELAEEFNITPIDTPEESRYELAIHKSTRKEIIIKADTIGAIISTFRAVLYQREKSPFTNRDLKLRERILEIYTRTTPSPFPVGFSHEPKFVVENLESES